jgi:hypothetical protein
MAVVRLLVPIALVACGVSSSRRTDDAAIDAPHVVDAPPFSDAATDEPPPHVVGPCDAPPMFFEPYAPSRILHVVPGASGGDGSSAAPFGTIAKAAVVATPGTFILLAPGVHASDQFVADLRGTPQAPIWIGGTSNTRPVIAGGVQGLHLTRPAYVVIQRLELRGQHANGINIDDGVAHASDAHHVAIVDVYIHDVFDHTNASCVRASGVEDLAIYDSRLFSCTAGISQYGVHRGVLARNHIANVLSYGIRASAGSTDIDIRQNRLDQAGYIAISLGGESPVDTFRPPLSTVSPNAEARRLRAFDNVVTGNPHVPFVFQGCTDCLVAHNLTYGEPQRVLRILPRTPPAGYAFERTRDGRVINNSFVFGVPNAHVDVIADADGSSFVFANNLWYSFISLSWSEPVGLPVAETGSVVGVGTGYAGGVSMYCGGPETGAAAPLPEVEGTIEGFCRADGHEPTIGPMVAGSGCTL